MERSSSRWLLLILLALSSVLTAADQCQGLFCALSATPHYQKQAQPIGLPAPQIVEAWFRSVYDPNSTQGDTLILNPAFRQAFREVTLKEIAASDLPPKEREALVKSLGIMLDELAKKAPPGQTEVLASDVVAIKSALENHLKTQKFAYDWNKTLLAHPQMKEIHEKVSEIFRSDLAKDPESIRLLLAGVSPMVISATVRESFHKIALEKIDKAWVPESVKVRLRVELQDTVHAWEREQKTRRQQLGKEETNSDETEFTPTEIAGFKKALEDYLKSASFKKCMSKPAILLGISEAVNWIGGSVAREIEEDKREGSFVGKMTNLDNYSHALEPSHMMTTLGTTSMQKQLAWNFLLTASIGGSCLNLEAFAGNNRFKKWATKPTNFNGFVLSPIMGVVAELTSPGAFNPGNILLGALWARYISVPKMGLANRVAGALPKSLYPLVLLSSESFSAFFYPIAAHYLFPEDDGKKKLREEVEAKEKAARKRELAPIDAVTPTR